MNFENSRGHATGKSANGANYAILGGAMGVRWVNHPGLVCQLRAIGGLIFFLIVILFSLYALGNGIAPPLQAGAN